MSSITLNPYIFFKGECREAMEFYKAIFDGELTFQTYQDSGMASEQTPAEFIMHAQLSGGDVLLMASDTAQASPEAKKVSLSLSGNDDEKLHRIFDSLCEGGQIQQPLVKAPWGDTFGNLVDKYSVEWMVNINAN